MGVTCAVLFSLNLPVFWLGIEDRCNNNTVSINFASRSPVTVQCAISSKQSRWLVGLAFASCLLAVTILTLVPLSTNDFWLQVAVGRIVWETHSIPDTILFAFTEARDFPFHAHEWAPSVVFYLLYDLCGYQNLIWFKGALGIMLAGLVYLLSYQINRNVPSSLLVTLVTMVAANFRHFVRPEIFGYIFLLILLNLIERYEQTRNLRWLAPLPFLGLVWANFHGSCFIGLVIIGIIGFGILLSELLATLRAGEKINLRSSTIRLAPYALTLLMMAGLMLINPNGASLFLFSWDFAHWEFTKHTFYEWVPTYSARFVGTRAFWAYVGFSTVLLGTVIKGRKNLHAPQLLLLIAFAYLAIERQRHIALFAFVGAYIFAYALKGPCHFALPERTRTLGAATLGIVCSLLAVGFGNLYGASFNHTFSWKLSPQAIGFIEQRHLQGRVFNSLTLGAEIVEKFYPRLTIAIDSRIDAYGEAYFFKYQTALTDEESMLNFIDHYGVNYLIVTFMDYQASIQNMSKLATSGWWPIFNDDKIVILGKR